MVTRERPARRRRSLVAVRDPTAREVVGRELQLHPVARDDADVELLHLAGRVGEHRRTLVDLDAVHPAGEGLLDGPLYLDARFLLAHRSPLLRSLLTRAAPVT